MNHSDKTLASAVATAIGRQNELSPRSVQVLAWLIENVDEKGRFYTLSDFRDKLATEIRTTQNTVQSCIAQLRARGLVIQRMQSHYEIADWIPTKHVLAGLESFDVVTHCVVAA
jgi:hypothetical protein